MAVRVLIFGTSGSGKTSMINAITGQNLATSPDARGCTFDTFTSPPYAYNSKEYIFIDTAGLDEDNENGTVSARKAVRNLVKFLRNSKDGFNLLVLAFRAGRITQSLVNNYELFVNKMTNKKIKVLCVVTGCENEEGNMNNWVIRNEGNFNNSGLSFDGMIGTCFAVGGRFEDTFKRLREESVKLVMDKVIQLASVEPINFMGSPGQFKSVFIGIWNFIVDVMKLPSEWKWLSQQIHKILVALGYSAKEAIELANEIENNN